MLPNFLVSLAALALVVCSATTALAGRVPCTAVLGALDRLAGDGLEAKPPDAEHVARALGTNPHWVQRCAQVYGRRVTVPPRSEDFYSEDQEERWEAEEEEEVAPEERQASGDTYEGQIPDEKRRPRKFGEDAWEWEPSLQKPWSPEMQDGWQPTLLDDDL